MKKLAVFLVLLIIGCTPHGLINPVPNVSNSSNTAEIVIFREWAFTAGGAPITITLDGVPIFGIKVNEHTVIRVPPGEHLLSSKISTKYSIENNFEAGKKYYYVVQMGFTGLGWRQIGRLQSKLFLEKSNYLAVDNTVTSEETRYIKKTISSENDHNATILDPSIQSR